MYIYVYLDSYHHVWYDYTLWTELLIGESASSDGFHDGLWQLRKSCWYIFSHNNKKKKYLQSANSPYRLYRYTRSQSACDSFQNAKFDKQNNHNKIIIKIFIYSCIRQKYKCMWHEKKISVDDYYYHHFLYDKQYIYVRMYHEKRRCNS